MAASPNSFTFNSIIHEESYGSNFLQVHFLGQTPLDFTTAIKEARYAFRWGLHRNQGRLDRCLELLLPLNYLRCPGILPVDWVASRTFSTTQGPSLVGNILQKQKGLDVRARQKYNGPSGSDWSPACSAGKSYLGIMTLPKVPCSYIPEILQAGVKATSWGGMGHGPQSLSILRKGPVNMPLPLLLVIHQARPLSI